jgi:hypothetical protein
MLPAILKSDGVNVLYSGYSWWENVSWNLSLYQASYTIGNAAKEKNMHKETLQTIKKSVKTFAKDFDCRTMGQDKSNYNEFFGDQKLRWAIRHATGTQLNGGNKLAATAEIQGVEEVYRYYTYYPEEWNRKGRNFSNGPEITPNTNPTQKKLSDYDGCAHYMLGNVYKDEEGSHWIVVSMSGTLGDEKNKETAPISELVSFDNLQVSSDGKYVTNLGTAKQTIRGNIFLHNIFNNSYTSPAGFASRVVKHVKENAGVDISKLYQLAVAKSGSPRNASHHVSLAYRDPARTDEQPLLRYLYPIDLSNENPPVYYWQYYVNEPDLVSEIYDADKFGSKAIALQDLTVAENVKAYSKDFYACQPIYSKIGGDNVTKRNPRSSADERASNPANYFYNANTWNTYAYPLDMWNAPVLMFRVTAVYDRGDDEYSTKTIDGHTLTLVSQCSDYDDIESEQDRYVALTSPYSNLDAEWSNIKKATNFMNGKNFLCPAWNEAWQF